MISMEGSNLVGCKVKYCRVVWWWNESRTYLFKEYVLIVYRNIYSYLNRHICDGNFEKRTNVGLFWKNWQVSHPHGVLWQAPHHQDRQDDKCPTNARGGWARNFVVCIRSRTRSVMMIVCTTLFQFWGHLLFSNHCRLSRATKEQRCFVKY